MNQKYLKGFTSDMYDGKAIIFAATENNIVSFLKRNLLAERVEIRTLDGKRFITALSGKWIDICPDRKYLEEKLNPLIQAVKDGTKKLLPLKKIQEEEVKGYQPPIPDWNYFQWIGLSDEDYEKLKSQDRPDTVEYEAFGEKFPLQLKVEQYFNTGNLAIEMISWKNGYPEDWSILTVNLMEICEKDCSYVDTNHHGKKILTWITENGLGSLTGETYRSGFCTYEKVHFHAEKLKELDLEGYQKYAEQFEEK